MTKVIEVDKLIHALAQAPAEKRHTSPIRPPSQMPLTIAQHALTYALNEMVAAYEGVGMPNRLTYQYAVGPNANGTANQRLRTAIDRGARRAGRW